MDIAAVHGRCVLISGGDFAALPPRAPGDFVIACDRGVQWAAQAGIKPDLIVGDFDSYTGVLPADVPVIRLRPEKDDTDTMSAIRWALQELQPSALLIGCAMGGRFDHAFANIQAAAFAAARGVPVTLLGANETIWVQRGGYMRLPRREGVSLSVFALSNECTGVTIRGAKYALNQAVLTNAFPLGVSNEWAADTAEIWVAQGLWMAVECRK